MFIQNKYTQIYHQIINNAQQANRIKLKKLEPNYIYFEKHHIIPKCLFGSNSKSNLVLLTAREHFICHWLLIKMTLGNDQYKMMNALRMMRSSGSQHDRYDTKITSRVYENLRIKMPGIVHSAETKSKISAANKGRASPLKGKKRLVSDLEHAKRSQRLKGKTYEELYGIEKAAIMRAKISASIKGKISSQESIEKRRIKCIGQVRTPEQLATLRASYLIRQPRRLATDEEKKITAQKISAANKGKEKSQEHKDKISASLTGISTGPKSEETKQKMRKPKSEAHKRAISEGRKAKYEAKRNLLL